MAVNHARDLVRVRVRRGEGLTVKSLDPSVPGGERNTAHGAALAVLRKAGLSASDVRVEIEVAKGVEPGVGLGSSGATAAAAAYALNEALGSPLSTAELVEAAGEGEAVAAGTPHYDNVAASLLGGVAVVVSRSPLRVVRLEPPEGLLVVLAVPRGAVEVPGERKTEFFRGVLPSHVTLSEAVEQCSAAAEFLVGLMLGDLEALGRAVSRGGVVEASRGRLIRGYWEVKRRALESGALGVNIAGAGPSVFALAREGEARAVAEAVREAFAEAGVEAEVRVLRPEPVGARVERKVQ